jgi:aldehyde:ferredoxin oxidoreductase
VNKASALEPALPIMPTLVESQDWLAVRDSLILCAFATDWTGDERMVSLYNAITGERATRELLMERAHGIWTLTRAFNVREGFSRKDDTVSWRLVNDPLPSGRAKGAVAFLSEADRNACLDTYYELRGWAADGVPTTESMRAARVPFAL